MLCLKDLVLYGIAPSVFMDASIFSPSDNREYMSNRIIHYEQSLMIFMLEVVLITIGILECRCDRAQARAQARANALSQTFAIARTRERTQTRLNERKYALAFATWAEFAFECV